MDVHKAIRRAHPAPKARIQRKDGLIKDAAAKDGVLVDLIEGGDDQAQRVRKASLTPRTETPNLSSSPRTTSLLVRKGSAGQTVSVKANYEDMREHLKHLGPSNKASNPKSTRVSAVKIKPGMGHAADQHRSDSVATGTNSEELERDADERTTLLRPRPSQEDGPQDYGSRTAKDAGHAERDILIKVDQEHAKNGSTEETSPTDSVGSNLGVPRRSRGHARSGSITENVVEQGGIRKVVLKLTSATGHEHDIRPAAETASSTSQDTRAEDDDDNEERKRKKKGGK